jgi:hypothetical protein
MHASRIAAIAASAYNVCGPRSGEPATPATVRSMADDASLAAMLDRYVSHVIADPDPLYSAGEVIAARGELLGRA